MKTWTSPRAANPLKGTALPKTRCRGSPHEEPSVSLGQQTKWRPSPSEHKVFFGAGSRGVHLGSLLVKGTGSSHSVSWTTKSGLFFYPRPQAYLFQDWPSPLSICQPFLLSPRSLKSWPRFQHWLPHLCLSQAKSTMHCSPQTSASELCPRKNTSLKRGLGEGAMWVI